jgi:hypothetical protein
MSEPSGRESPWCEAQDESQVTVLSARDWEQFATIVDRSNDPPTEALVKAAERVKVRICGCENAPQR